MATLKLTDTVRRFLAYARVARLATLDDGGIHLVPICPVFAGDVLYMGTHARTRKVRNLRRSNAATLLVDQYSEDWMRHIGVMLRGTVDVIERGPEFERAKGMLEAKYPQYPALFPIEEGESVVLRFHPTKAVTWDYARGELNEPH